MGFPIFSFCCNYYKVLSKWCASFYKVISKVTFGLPFKIGWAKFYLKAKILTQVFLALFLKMSSWGSLLRSAIKPLTTLINSIIKPPCATTSMFFSLFYAGFWFFSSSLFSVMNQFGMISFWIKSLALALTSFQFSPSAGLKSLIGKLAALAASYIAFSG